MDDVKESSIGYMKFSGDAVQDGVIAASAAGNALIGFDECLRYFCNKQSSTFSRLEYEIPVKTTEGSWVAWLLGALGTGAMIYGASYLKKAGEKMAENDFDQIGLRDVLRKSIDALRHLISVVKHTKGNVDWASADLSWQISEGSVGLTNEAGDVIYVPVEYFKWYLGLPRNLLKQLTGAVGSERTLTIGVREDSEYQTVSVSAGEKGYFGHEDDSVEEEFLFPELEHGQFVRLEGRLTRGNENSNSVGLEYEGHVINCVPESGSIKRYKPALFLRCVVDGMVSRLFKQPFVAERRPTIIFSNITPLETDDQLDMFER